MQIKGAFAALLAPFLFDGKHPACFLQCEWLNPNYFSNSKGTDISQRDTPINELLFKEVRIQSFERLKQIENQLALKLEGSVRGVIDGKIALHDIAGYPLMDCSLRKSDMAAASKVVLNVIKFRQNNKKIL